MTAIDLQTLSRGRGLRARFAEFVAETRAARARHALFRRTYDELNSLSDRDLTDLDIRRDQIADIAREAAFSHK